MLSAAGGTLFARLKAETADAHARIERTLDVMRPDLTRAAYARVLGRFWGFHEPWERAAVEVVRGDEVEALIGGRRKAPWLAADLAVMGVEVGRLPRCGRMPRTADVADVIGAMYVLEGATLGGRYVARHVEAVLGLRDGTGYSYFRSYGAETGRMWQSFRAEAGRRAEGLDHDAICAAACETFERLDNWVARD